ncbi:hypothetical protein HZA56_04490 [Candidatus Poribacteria bacterium]|nr:hypothetical protein [Candidatus Poribacteria bacterium]
MPEKRPQSTSNAFRRLLRAIDFAVIPLLLTALRIDPVYFVYLRWPEAEKLFCETGYRFLGEIGQFLAWANAAYHGEWHGRDFFCLYGPLYIYSIVATWKIAGKSVQALFAYWHIMSALTCIAAYAFFRQFWSRRVLCVVAALALTFTTILEYPVSACRFTAALGALALLAAHARGIRGLLIPAGILVGLAVMTSQEVGIAVLAASFVFLICGDIGRGLRRMSGRIGFFALGFAAAAAPAALVFHLNGALWPMVQNVIEYPSAVNLGYGNYPFPRVDSVLPLNLTGAPPGALLVRAGVPSTMLFYYAPSLYAVSLVYLFIRLVLGRWKLDTFDSMVAALTAAGIMLFGVALGRSDYAHLIFALPPAVLLHLLFIGHVTRILYAKMSLRRTVSVRRSELAACSVILVVSISFFNPSLMLKKTVSSATGNFEKMILAFRLPKPPPEFQGPPYMEVVDYIKQNTTPRDYVLALPSNSAYYYFVDRENPTRFCQFSMLATNKHRAEVLEDIRERRPKYVIYDITGERVDDISDEVQFRDALDFILQNYVAVKRVGNTLLLLDGGRIPNRQSSETTIFDRDLTRPENVRQMGLRGARVVDVTGAGSCISLEIPQSELELQNMGLDSREFYLLRIAASIEKGNIGRVSWAVKGIGKRRVYSKMLCVAMDGEWETYEALIATPEPSGVVESLKLIPSDEPTRITIRSIKLTRLNNLSLPTHLPY